MKTAHPPPPTRQTPESDEWQYNGKHGSWKREAEKGGEGMGGSVERMNFGGRPQCLCACVCTRPRRTAPDTPAALTRFLPCFFFSSPPPPPPPPKLSYFSARPTQTVYNGWIACLYSAARNWKNMPYSSLVSSQSNLRFSCIKAIVCL